VDVCPTCSNALPNRSAVVFTAGGSGCFFFGFSFFCCLPPTAARAAAGAADPLGASAAPSAAAVSVLGWPSAALKKNPPENSAHKQVRPCHSSPGSMRARSLMKRLVDHVNTSLCSTTTLTWCPGGRQRLPWLLHWRGNIHCCAAGNCCIRAGRATICLTAQLGAQRVDESNCFVQS
jgi:hypothetical protein